MSNEAPGTPLERSMLIVASRLVRTASAGSLGQRNGNRTHVIASGIEGRMGRGLPDWLPWSAPFDPPALATPRLRPPCWPQRSSMIP